MGTEYNYYWIGSSGQTIYQLKGRHHEHQKKKRIKPGNPWYFVQAAEISWSMFYYAYLNDVLAAEGSIPFRVDKGRYLRVGPAFLEFHFGAEPVRVTREEIASVSLAQGQFSFKHKDAKWYSSAGKFSFAYARIGNARVFLVALEKLVGYRWG